ncbi:MAG TPA: hypothetical protein VMT64_09300 [Candidatus Binataceae bacterium]|nr:hypothetical protein [Candidatus Binataceae bacterium]
MSDIQTGTLKGAIDNILKFTEPRSSASRARRAQEYCRAIARRDYDRALKQHFDRAQLHEILGEIRRTLPTLNRQIYRITDRVRLAQIAHKLGVTLQDHAFRGSDSAGFRGFYVNEKQVLKNPIIWVNTAAHPAAVAAAFWHEVGHHLTAPIWGTSQSLTTLANSGGREDFSDPKELAADMVRVLGGYPEPIAVRLFGGADMEFIREDADALVAKTLPHLRAVMGLELGSRFSPQENLFYLGGAIHTAKLRTTLLSQYGI